MRVEGFIGFLALASLAIYRETAHAERTQDLQFYYSDAVTVVNVTMPETDSMPGSRNFFLPIGELTSLDFKVFGCGGLRLSLLRSVPVAAAANRPFIQVYIGYDMGTHGVIIRECPGGRETCEDRVQARGNVVFCYDYSPFWMQWNESTFEIGGGFYNIRKYWTTLTSYNPPPPQSPSTSPPAPPAGANASSADPAEKGIVNGSSAEAPVRLLTGIRIIGVENENRPLFFTVFRSPKMNYCFVGEKEEPMVTQCGDDYIVRERCLDCGCCYDAIRQPPCYQSFATGNTSLETCTRSLEELFPDMMLFLSPQPKIYVNDTIDHLFVIGNFISLQFQFGIDFGDEHLNLMTNFTRAEPLPAWLSESPEFQKLQWERDFSAAQVSEMYRCSIVHVYKKVKTFRVNLHVSGRLKRNNESSWTSWNKSLPVTVHGRPTLEEALNGTFLFSSYPVHRPSAASFFFLVRNSDSSIVCTFVFADGSPMKNVSLVEMSADQIPRWMANGSFSSADVDREVIPGLLADIGEFRGGVVQHDFRSFGLTLVNLTVSGNLKSVGVQSSVTRTVAVDVRPSLMDEAGPMLFISRTPAYVGTQVPFLFLIRTHDPLLRYEINYDDRISASERLEINFNGASVPDWVQRKYYKLHGVQRSDAENILSQSNRYNCSLASHVFERVGRHSTKVTVSGALAAVGRHEQVVLMSIVDVIEKRQTIWELLATFVLLTSQINYVNESAYFLYRFGDFSDDLELLVDYGDSNQTESLSVTGSATLPDWARSGQYVSSDENKTAMEQIFSDHGDSFLGGVSGHEYAQVGTYNVTLTVRSVRNVTHGEIQRRMTVTVQRRPTLAEVIGQVIVLVRRPVYEGTNTTVLVLVENDFPALSYDLDFGDDSYSREVIVGQNLALPIWENISAKSSYFCPQDSCAVVTELFSRTPNISSAVIRHMYATPGQRNISVTVSGWLDIVARTDEHRSAVVVVEVKPRLKLSDSLGPSVLLVTDPATVDENVRFLFIGTQFVADVDFRLDFGDGSPVEMMTPISSNLDALYWMSDQRFVALGSAVDGELPKVVWDLTRFNGTAATQTHVYAAESVYPVYLRLSSEFKIPLEMGRFSLKVERRSTAGNSDPVDWLPQATASVRERVASSSSPAAVSPLVSVSSLSSANGAGALNDDTRVLPTTIATSAAVATTSAFDELRCGSVEVVVTGGGLQRQSPAKFSRRDTFHLKAHVLRECHRHLLEDVVWKVYRLSERNIDDIVEIWMPSAFVSETEVHILRYTMDYGTYKVQAKIVQGGREFVGDAYVAITSSPLTVKILGDDVIQTDIETPVTVTAEAGIDVDEPRELSYGSVTFEWLCMNTGEKSPYSDPIHEDNAEGVGCYGNGRRMNSTSKEFHFEPDLLYYSELPTYFTVQVALTKPNRPRALASQSIIVVFPENPLRVRCTFNCGAFMNTWMALVLNTTCGAPVCREAKTLSYRWDFLPLCPQNSVKQLRWMKDTATNFNESSLHVKPNVFGSSKGNEPYQFTLSVTVDESRQFEARYQFLTRRPPPAAERAKFDQSAMTGANNGQRIAQLKTEDFCFVLLPQIFLFIMKTA